MKLHIDLNSLSVGDTITINGITSTVVEIKYKRILWFRVRYGLVLEA